MKFRRLDADEDHWAIGQFPMITTNLLNASGKPFCSAEIVGNFGCMGTASDIAPVLSILALMVCLLFSRFRVIESHTSLGL